MNLPTYPAALSVAQWERQAGPAAKARPTLVTDALRAAQKAVDGLSLASLDPAKCDSLEALAAARTRFDAECDRGLRQAATALRAVGGAVAKWTDGQNRRDASLQKAFIAAGAAEKAGTDHATALERIAEQMGDAFDARKLELEEEARKAEATQPPKPSPERTKVKNRVLDQFRIAKAHPDQKVCYLAVIGNNRAAAWLGPTASDSNRPLLKKAVNNDQGMKFFKGEVKYEEGYYTFVGPLMNKTLGRRLADGLTELIGSGWRIRGRE